MRLGFGFVFWVLDGWCFLGWEGGEGAGGGGQDAGAWVVLVDTFWRSGVMIGVLVLLDCFSLGFEVFEDVSEPFFFGWRFGEGVETGYFVEDVCQHGGWLLSGSRRCICVWCMWCCDHLNCPEGHCVMSVVVEVVIPRLKLLY